MFVYLYDMLDDNKLKVLIRRETTSQSSDLITTVVKLYRSISTRSPNETKNVIEAITYIPRAVVEKKRKEHLRESRFLRTG